MSLSASELLGGLARVLLEGEDAANGSRLRLAIRDDGTVAFCGSVAGLQQAHERLARRLGEADSAEILRREDRFELRLSLREDSGPLQSPDVLLALRDAAAGTPRVGFVLELPAGVRDVQRARAGLDSRPPRDGS